MLRSSWIVGNQLWIIWDSRRQATWTIPSISGTVPDHEVIYRASFVWKSNVPMNQQHYIVDSIIQLPLQLWKATDVLVK